MKTFMKTNGRWIFVIAALLPVITSITYLILFLRLYMSKVPDDIIPGFISSLQTACR